MVEDLNVPVAIRVCPTVREADGLAMSSRNRYLGSDARRRATALYRSLELASHLVRQGQTAAQAIVARMCEVLLDEGQAQIEYVALVDPDTLLPVEQVTAATLALIAARIDDTRLIDNAILRPY